MRDLGACRSAALAAVVLLGPLAAGAQVPPTAPDKFDLRAIGKVAAKAPPLPEPAGTVVRVKTAEELRAAARAAEPGTTILLADGRYDIDRLRIRADRLSLRGASGDRDKVILDGGGKFSRVVEIRGAKDVLIADLTVANAGQYGVLFYGDSDVQRLKVYNVKFHNCWVRGLKGTHPERINDGYRRRHPPETVEKIRPAGGEVRYCLFVNDHVNPHTRPFGGDYIGGMDMMWLKDWVIADNVFVGIRGRNGGGRGAIFIWVNSQNAVAERNLIFHCDRGICFGNPSGEPPHMTGGIVRNNFIVTGRSQAIEICQTKNVLVANNTVYAADPTRVAAQFHRRNEGARCINNLFRGRLEAPEQVEKAHNLMGELSGFFRRPETGDLRLTGKAGDALGKGKPLKEVAEDFDGQKRKSPPDVGADDYSLPAKTRPRPSSQARSGGAPGGRQAMPARSGQGLLNRPNPDVAAVLKLARKAPPLPKPAEPIIHVKPGQAEAIYQAARACKPGTTILLADGVYRLNRPVVISTDRVSLRGASGDREKVILDRGGGRRRGGACVQVRGADDVLVADLTCRDSSGYGVHIEPHIGAQRTRIYNCKFHNLGTRGVKGSHPKLGYEPVGQHREEILRKRPRGGEIRYCLFLNDQRKAVNDAYGGDYIGGIDMMWLKDWVIADNVFIGIRGRNGGGRGAIFIWVNSEDVVAERNIIINCDRGIAFGNPSGSRPHMIRGIVRNNFIVGGTDKAIEMCRTVDTMVYHNTIYTENRERTMGVHFFQGSEGGRLFNNIVHGPVNLEAGVAGGNNIVGDCTGWFVNPAISDLHLTEKAAAAIGKGTPLKEAQEDFDGQKRKSPPDVGADEYSLPAKTPPTPAAPGR